MTTVHRRRIAAILGLGILGAGGLSPASAAAPEVADPQRIRFVTVNIDFGASADQVRADFARYSESADIVMFQEARDVRLSNLVDNDTWIVRQDTASETTRGSALAIRRTKVRDADAVTGFRLVKGTDGGPCPDGGIQTRWIAVADVHLRNGATIVAASLHMPPPRCATGPGSLYAVMADNVVASPTRIPPT